MNTSDRIIALAGRSQIDHAEAKSIAVMVRRMEVALDDACQEARNAAGAIERSEVVSLARYKQQRRPQNPYVRQFWEDVLTAQPCNGDENVS